MLAGMVTWITWLASIVGSAWPGSPWLRMQEVHCWSNWAGLPFDPVVAEPPLGGELPRLLPLLPPTLATCGVVDPPPHAASPMAAAAARTASPPDRRYVLVISLLPDSFVARR
jgi:hypothetical protein